MGQSGKLRGLGLRDPGSNPGSPISNMASKLKKTKSAGRFGVKHGRRVRAKLVAVETKQRKKQKCPFCEKEGVKRVSKGIWKCPKKKCGKKFASGTYYVNQ